MRISKLCMAAAMIVMPSLVAAKPVTMQCLVDGSNGGWIADQIFFEYDSDRDAARVVDGIIMHFAKQPASAEISEDTAKKLVIKWRVHTKVGRQTTRMSYRLALFKTNNRVTVQAHPHGFVNNYTARGKCQRINQRLPTG